MSFLFEDDILAKLVVESGILNQLNKYGQQVTNEAKLIATKLTNELMQQAKATSNVGEDADLEVYPQDLTDLVAYLNFLWKNNVKYGDNLIAYHDASSGGVPPANAELYVTSPAYPNFHILKNGLIEKLRELDNAAQQAGNELIRPFIKNLIAQANQSFSLGYESNPNNAVNQGGQGEQNKGQSGNPQGTVPSDQGDYRNVSYRPGNESGSNASGKLNAGAAKIAGELMRDLPFASDDSLSPYAMYRFIEGSVNLISYLQLSNERLRAEFSQFFNSIQTMISGWEGLVSRDKASSYRMEVPYNRHSRPHETLETIFGSEMEGKAAAQRLLQMVVLMRQALASLNRSPEITSLISQDILNGQITKARAFEESLTPYARS